VARKATERNGNSLCECRRSVSDRHFAVGVLAVARWQITAYAILAETPWAAAPDIATVDAAGVPGLYIAVLARTLGSRGTPEQIVAKLCATIASCDDFEDIVEWASIISISCGSSPSSTMAVRVRVGCATW
jgi:hypothetical protein